MFGTTRNDCAAGILAIVLGVTFVPTALAAEDWGFSNGAPSAVEFEEAPAPVETEAEKRWFENQSIAPPPGGSEPTADEATDNAIDLIEDGLVDTGSIRRVDLPSILEDSDAELYRKIFELQEKGRWK